MKSNPMQGTKGTGKSVEPDAALGNPTGFPAGIRPNGGKQAMSQVTRDSQSNHETLRHGSKPKPEVVRQAAHDGSARARAHKFNERSQNGGANPMAAAQSVNE
jgi:hypothetical protein